MLSVDIEKIIPLTEARDMFNKIVDEVEGSDELYVLTKNGKPAAVVVGVNHLEKLTGETSGEIMTKVSEATVEPKEEAEEAVKPFDTSMTTPVEPVAETTAVTPSDTPPTTDVFDSTPTDSFSATLEPSSTTQPSSFNAAPAMPEETSTADTPNPMAPVVDSDGKTDEPASGATSTSTPPSNPPTQQT